MPARNQSGARPVPDHALGEIGIVAAKIAAFIVLVLVLVLVGLVLVVLILILILIPVPLPPSHTAATDGVDPRRVRQASVIAKHRTDAVEQQPAADHPRRRRCGCAEK